MKLYKNKFEKQLKEFIGDDGTINCVNIRKNKECYDIMISINHLGASLFDIKDGIYMVNEKYYHNEINIGKITVEI